MVAFKNRSKRLLFIAYVEHSLELCYVNVTLSLKVYYSISSLSLQEVERKKNASRFVSHVKVVKISTCRLLPAQRTERHQGNYSVEKEVF